MINIYIYIPIHIDVLVRAKLPLAEVAGLEETAREGVAAVAVARASGGARPHHLLQDYVRRVRVPVPVPAVVVVVHQDLEPHDEALTLASTPAAAAAAHGHGRRCRADDADAVVHGGGATLLPEVEDALPSWQHGGEEP